MRRLFVFLATAAVVIATAGGPRAAEDCIAADPLAELGGGDFEIRVDPEDAAKALIYVANLGKDIVAARLDGTTGKVVSGSRTTIVSNFAGEGTVQGPELVRAPSGELGLLYAGELGVHGVFRKRNATWNSFKFDVNGTRISGSPPPLPATSVGAYPRAPFLFGQRTYGQWNGDCVGVCYADLTSPTWVDIGAELTAVGFTGGSSVPSPNDGYIFFSACNANNKCGLYQGNIYDSRGFRATVRKIAQTNTAPESMAADRHPLTGTTVLFTNEEGNAVSVWEQRSVDGNLRLVDSVPIGNLTTSEHYRVETNSTDMVLHYFGGSTGPTQTAHTILVSAMGSQLIVGDSKLISSHGRGSELVWVSAANKWALFYPTAVSRQLRRCWVTP